MPVSKSVRGVNSGSKRGDCFNVCLLHIQIELERIACEKEGDYKQRDSPLSNIRIKESYHCRDREKGKNMEEVPHIILLPYIKRVLSVIKSNYQRHRPCVYQVIYYAGRQEGHQKGGRIRGPHTSKKPVDITRSSYGNYKKRNIECQF